MSNHIYIFCMLMTAQAKFHIILYKTITKKRNMHSLEVFIYHADLTYTFN